MSRFNLTAALVAALFSPLIALAAEASNQELREQIQQLRQEYESRLQALESRLETTQNAAPPQPDAAPASQIAPSAQRSGNAFNPSVALILNGSYGFLSQDPETYRLQGFIPGGEEVGPGERGFSLGESELTLSAAIDHRFLGALTFALGADESVEVEEAKVETLGLSHGLKIKFGRFLSGLGYLNEHHAHSWDFTDAPLAYQAFYGGSFKNDGLQIRWLAPSERYLELGGEIGLGSSFPGGERQRNGAGVWTAFARSGDDIGTNASWQANLWFQHSNAQNRAFDAEDSAGAGVVNAFSGESDSWGLGWVYKWSPNGHAVDRNLKLQGEYFRRREKGRLSYDVDNQSLGFADGAYRSSQSGWYLQSTYQFVKGWRAGLRYDQLDAGDTHIGLIESGALTADDFAQLQSFTPKRISVMTDYAPSEFSRLRLQYNRDQTSQGRDDNQIFVQYIMSLGAHGAHLY